MCAKSCSPVLPSAVMYARMAVTDSAHLWSVSAYSFRTASSLAVATAARTLSLRPFARSCHCRSCGVSLSVKSFSPSSAAQSSSTFCSFDDATASSSPARLVRPSAAVARSLISSAGRSWSQVSGFALFSAPATISSTALRLSAASFRTAWIASRCSSRSLLFSSSSARLARARTSDFATANFRCRAWNFSYVTGSRIRMILSRTSWDGSKSWTTFPKDTTSSRLSDPSLSWSCFSKCAFRSRSFFRATALFLAFSRVEDTV
mmetsp:Transcript_117128/g.331883  ORF Transcript_117128/g.331883 Transcript_117128/m.331883 type:complete len:262 (-) Transcript_117128:1146-1931(-)